MLIQFSIRNFKTFKEKATLSMVASNYDKNTRVDENIVDHDKFHFKLLKSAVIYGANASGKSKFIEALMFMKHFILSISKDIQKGDEIPIEPFLLDAESEQDSSEFEVIFIFKNVLYRYGFETNKHKIISEWLYRKLSAKDVELFYRDYQNFETHPRSFKKGAVLVKEDLIRDNALLLPLAAQFNDSIATEVIDWFHDLKTISGLAESGYQAFTMSLTQKPKLKEKILELLKAVDLGIQDVNLEPLDVEKLPKNMPKSVKNRILKEVKEENAEFFSDVLTFHKKYDKSKKHIGNAIFSLEDDESSGTRKFFALTGPILYVLEHGCLLIVDELDSKLHPNLVCKLVSLFNSKDLNPNNAQLVFNTHDTNLLSSGLFRRDQIWFTEKNKFGEAKLYSLADFKSETVRKTEAFEENYIRGKYGAVPFLGNFDSLVHDKLLLHEDEK